MKHTDNVLIRPRPTRQMSFPFLHGLKPSGNNIIIKLFKYVPLGVAYHQVIEPIIVDLVAQFRLDNLHCPTVSSHEEKERTFAS